MCKLEDFSFRNCGSRENVHLLSCLDNKFACKIFQALAYVSNIVVFDDCIITDDCPRVMVLKTLKIMTPIGRPGIINPARKGDKTFNA
jgi:hypothetical protein